MKKLLTIISPIFLFGYGYTGFTSTTNMDYSMKSSCKEMLAKGITKDGLPEQKELIEDKSRSCQTNKDCETGFSCYKEYNVCIDNKYF